ncbi:MAG: carbon monoxide dehydrogenase [Acidocella sp. 20-57-95]|nr:MAG: carbon monoxide dehydrogenase [Acidocella sp. 20-57-95]OYV60379.1 MAG: carbon monoxide dehydrogenase [Acidocella sp. 21-58-7]HQT64814.1 xanthine dehydrogenase family protein molybdopterin-binding subunit [Acidocella sp.]
MKISERAFRAVGKPLARNEDLRLITGKGRFTDDFNLPGQLWAAMVRSPYPHARIRNVDGRVALQLPKVLAVYSGADCEADGLKEINHNPVPSTKYDLKLTGKDGGAVFIGKHTLLPTDRARYVGEAVAMVVAETREAALTGAENVMVGYEELPFVVGTVEATQPGAPILWDSQTDNILVDSSFGDAAATATAFAKAAHIVSDVFHIGRVTGVPLEPRAALGDYNSETGRYTLYAGSGGAVRQKHELAHVLGVEPKDVRVLSFDVGGNFGTRNRAYVEFGLVMWAARKLGRPVKFRADRSECFLTDYQGRDLVTEVSLAIDESGKFLAMRASNLSNVGARCVSLSPLSKGSGLITGSYNIPLATLRSRAVFSNTMPTQAYRSSGRPEVTFAIERLIDKAATQLNMDRFEIRRRNLVAPSQMPYRNAVGSTYDSGEYEINMDKLLRLADWQGAAARREDAKRRGKLLGIGFANYVESSIGTPKERADLIVSPEGIEVVIGTQPAGQGHETSFAQVTADLLGVPFERVKIILGDTDVVSAGGGTHSGRSMRHASAVIALASDDLVSKAKLLAAQIFHVAEGDVEFDDGVFKITGTNITTDWFDLAKRLKELQLEDFPGGLWVRRDNEMHTPVFPNGACMCEIEIDPETGGIEITRYATVDDVGRCINPLIVHGQTHGGIAQGVGQALWETCYIDPESGQPQNGSFMDYGMPRFNNLPFFKTEISEVLSPTNPFGVKAGGEGGTTPAPAVIMSAVENALAPLGITGVEMPATPAKIWAAIQKADRSALAEYI